MDISLPTYIHGPVNEEWMKIHFPDSTGLEYKLIFKVAYKIYLRTILAERQNHRCAICFTETSFKNKKTIPTFEHIIPRCEGGKVSLDNGVMTCYRCNNARKVKPLMDYYHETRHVFGG